MGETEGFIGGVGGRALTRAEYEAWVTEVRKKARRERIRRRVFQGAAIAALVGGILGLLVWAEYATAAPMPDPDVRGRIERQEPYVPGKGATLADAKAMCEKSGGHWLEQEDQPMPGMKVIGCLYAVPKGWK